MNRSLKATLVAVTGLVATVGFFGNVLLGSDGSAPIDTEYASESLRFVLRIDPSDPEGCGDAEYHLLGDDKEIWHRRLPFSLFDAQVLNDGTIAGYAYTTGLRGRRGESRNDHGDLVAVILSPQGNVRLKEPYRRAFGRRVMTGQRPEPMARAILADPDNDRLVFLATWNAYEFGKPAITAWRVFQLSTGKPLGVFWPEKQVEDARWLRPCVALQPVRGTSLLVAQWPRIEGELSVENPPILGTHFALLDDKCRTVWQLTSTAQDYGHLQRMRSLR